MTVIDLNPDLPENKGATTEDQDAVIASLEAKQASLTAEVAAKSAAAAAVETPVSDPVKAARITELQAEIESLQATLGETPTEVAEGTEPYTEVTATTPAEVAFHGTD